MLRSEAEGALSALVEYLGEVRRGNGETLFREADEFVDPFDFADRAINNLPAIAYALNAGLPVIGWTPAQKNAAEAERVLRAMRQWDEQSRLLLQRLANGDINQQEFYDGLVEGYIRQNTNAFVAGRRAVGDLTAPTTADYGALLDDMEDDLGRLGALQADLEGGMTIGGLIAAVILDPTNYFGSGLPGDPFAPKKAQAASNLAGGLPAHQQLRDYSNRMDQYGSNIRGRQFMGEANALDKYVPRDAQLVWWVLGPADHCIDCIRLSDMSPYYATALSGMYPGSGHTRCGGRCHCGLEYDLPSTVCADPFRGEGLADFGIHGEYGDTPLIASADVPLLASTAEPGKVNVFIQEAESCALPIDVSSLNARSEYSVIDDSEAFNWDSDVASLMRGTLDDSFTWDDLLRRLDGSMTRSQGASALSDADLAAFRRLFAPLENAMPGGLEGARIVQYEADGAKFAAAWKDTGDAIRLEVGMVTDGLPLLEPEFNLRLMSELSERASAKGVRFEINGEMLNPGARKWLDALGADHLALPGSPPTITPAFPLRGVAPEPPRTFGTYDEAVAWGEQTWPIPPGATVGDVWQDPSLVGMSRTEMDAMNSYAGGHFGYMNGRLRNTEGWEEMALDMAGWENAQEVDAWISAIDGVMSRYAVPEEVAVFRSIGKASIGGLDPTDAVGKTFTEPAFMSTTLGPPPDLDRIITGRDLDIHMVLTVPEGTPAYYTRNVSSFKDEHELLLARGLDYQITRAEQVGDEWLLEATVVSKAPGQAPLRGVAPEPPVAEPVMVAPTPEMRMQHTRPPMTDDEITEAMKATDMFAPVPDWAAEKGFKIDYWEHLPTEQRQYVLEAMEDLKAQGFTVKIATGGKTPESGMEIVGGGRTTGSKIELDLPTGGYGASEGGITDRALHAGDVFRHEYGHMLHVGGDAMGQIDRWLPDVLRSYGVDPAQTGRAFDSPQMGRELSTYAEKGGQREFVAEYFSAFTDPGYVRGTLPNDAAFEAALIDAGVLSGPRAVPAPALRGIAPEPPVAIPALAAADVQNWPTTRPWDRPIEDFRAGKVPGFELIDDKAASAGGLLAARADNDTIKVTSRFFADTGPYASAGRAQLLYHEVGHYTTRKLDMADVLGPWRVEGTTRFEPYWAGASGQPPNEIVADMYADLVMGQARPDFVADWSAERLTAYAKVAAEAQRIGLPVEDLWRFTNMTPGTGTIAPELADAMAALPAPGPLRGIAPEPPSPAVNAVDSFRNRYVQSGMEQQTEFGQVIDAQTGEVLVDRAGVGFAPEEQFRRDAGAAVEFTIEDQALMPGNIVTHIHPYDFSLSTGDILQALRKDVAQIRAESPGFRFILEPGPSGWLPEGITKGDLGAFKIRMDEEWNAFVDAAFPVTPKDLSFDEGVAWATRRATKDLADKYGWRYTELDIGPHVPMAPKAGAVLPNIPPVTPAPLRGVAPAPAPQTLDEAMLARPEAPVLPPPRDPVATYRQHWELDQAQYRVNSAITDNAPLEDWTFDDLLTFKDGSAIPAKGPAGKTVWVEKTDPLFPQKYGRPLGGGQSGIGVIYDEAGDAAAVVNLSLQKPGDAVPSTVAAVMVRPGAARQGWVTRLYDDIIDTHNVDVVGAMGQSHEFTDVGRAFANRFIEHRRAMLPTREYPPMVGVRSRYGSIDGPGADYTSIVPTAPDPALAAATDWTPLTEDQVFWTPVEPSTFGWTGAADAPSEEWWSKAVAMRYEGPRELGAPLRVHPNNEKPAAMLARVSVPAGTRVKYAGRGEVYIESKVYRSSIPTRKKIVTADGQIDQNIFDIEIDVPAQPVLQGPGPNVPPPDPDLPLPDPVVPAGETITTADLVVGPVEPEWLPTMGTWYHGRATDHVSALRNADLRIRTTGKVGPYHQWDFAKEMDKAPDLKTGVPGTVHVEFPKAEAAGPFSEGRQYGHARAYMYDDSGDVVAFADLNLQAGVPRNFVSGGKTLGSEPVAGVPVGEAFTKENFSSIGSVMTSRPGEGWATRMYDTLDADGFDIVNAIGQVGEFTEEGRAFAYRYIRGRMEKAQRLRGPNPVVATDEYAAPLRLLDHEEGLIIDARTGDLIEHVTPRAGQQKNEVRWTWEQAHKARDNIFVHNHPMPDTGYSTSFSRPDLQSFVETRPAVAKVVTDRFTYSMTPGPEGWPSYESMSRSLSRIEKREKARRIEAMQEFKASGMTPGHPEYADTIDRINAMNSPHTNMAEMADELGLTYRRTEVAPLRATPPKDPVAALPQWPEMSLLKDDLPEAVKAVGGADDKRIFLDAAGNRWLAKTREEAAIVETAVSRIGHELGVRVPPIRLVEIDGQMMSLQPMVPGEDLLHKLGSAPTNMQPKIELHRAAAEMLTEGQMSELASQSVLDFIVANADSHPGNWVIDDAGHLWGIDKGMGFFGVVALPADVEKFVTTYGGVFKAAVEHASTTGFFLKTSPADFARVLDRLDARKISTLTSLGEGRTAMNFVSDPFGNYISKNKALNKRIKNARSGFERLLDNAIGNAGKDVSPEWRAWREAGSTFITQAPETAVNAVVTAPATAMPTTIAAEQVPAMWRSTISAPSTAGNNRAMWQAGFSPAASTEAAAARVRALLPNADDLTLDAFDLPQMNLIVARLEHLKERGVDLGLLRGLSDYTTVPVSEHDFSIGITVGKKISLKQDNAWKFNPLDSSHPTAYDDIGGLLAHEYGHVIFHDLTPGAQTQLIDLYKAQKATAADDISTYAIESLDEWFGEAFTKITAPGYMPGTLRYDSEMWSILALDGKVGLQSLPVAPTVVPEIIPPLPEIVAKGPHKSTTEMVPTATLRQYADVKVADLDADLVAKVREDIAAHGMREPIVLEYSRTEQRLALTDGAARLAVAQEMGLKYVPARVERATGPFSTKVGMRSKKVPEPTFPDGHVPRNFKPSQVLPPDEWTVAQVANDVVVAPPLPPLVMGNPPFLSPPSDSLAVKPLPPGKKLGGMSSKQIYVDPAGGEWLVKPKKVFVDDVELSRAAIDLEAAVSPLANRLDLNVSGVVSTTIDYPWVPGDPLKTVGASIQPITPGISHMPTVPLFEDPGGLTFLDVERLEDQIERLSRSTDQWFEMLPDDVRDVLQRRTDDAIYSADINRWAVGKKTDVDFTADAALLDQAIDAGSVPEATVVYRGAQRPDLKVPKKDDILEDPTYLSTTTDPMVAANYATSDADEAPGIVYRIHLPQGHKAAVIGDHIPKHGYEREILLGRGTELKVAEVHPNMVIEGEERAVTIVDLVPTAPGTTLSPGSSKTAIPGHVAWDELSDSNLNDLAQNQMFDWFIGNDDGHIGQFLLDSNGKILGIDKDAAFWELPSQYAQGDAIPEYGKHIVHTWWQDMTPERLDRLNPKAVEDILNKIDAIPDEEYRLYIEPHLDVLLAHPNGVKMSRDQWRDAIMSRKRNMRADFTAYYQRQLSDLTEAGVVLPAKWQRVAKDGFREASPHRRPLPNPATKQNLRDAEAGWLGTRNTVQDVLDGKVDVSIGWNVNEFNAANAAGLKYRKIGGFRFHATSEEPLDRIAAYLAEPGHSSMDDGFWAAMGYTPEQIAVRNDLQRLMRPVANPTEGLPMGAKGGFIEVPVGQPLGPPKKAPKVPHFKPADHQMYTIGDSPIVLNGPRIEWSGKVPDEPPPPVGKATKEQIEAADKAAAKAYGDPTQVAEGKRDAVWSWDAKDAKSATDAGLVYESYKGARIIARTDEKVAELKAWLDVPGNSHTDDEFWHMLGYTNKDLDAIDTAAAVRGTKRLTAGVMIVEPDGRMWLLAPRGEFAGYQNTVIKGGADAGESLAAAAVREVREESGFSVELDAFLGDYGNPEGSGITRMYVGHRTGGGPLWAKQKETHEIRLVTADEAEQMLTRYNKPTKRDQAILADTVDALDGKPGLIDFAVPADETAEFAEKIGATDAGSVRPVATPESPVAKYAVNPDPAVDLPVGTLFGYNNENVVAGMASWTESPGSSTTFPYNTTRYKAPGGETATMYWKPEFGTTKGGDVEMRLFWGNSKKQISDPKLRFEYHVAQVVRLADRLIEQPELAFVRVNEKLLDQIPQLREMLLAAGGTTTGTGKFIDIDRNAFGELGDAIRNNTPLTIKTGHVPTGPMMPEPKTVGAAGYDVKKVGSMFDALTTAVGKDSAGLPTMDLNWAVPGLVVNTDVAIIGDGMAVALGSLNGLTSADQQAMVVAHLGVLAGLATDTPAVKRLALQVGWDDDPGVAALLDTLGLTKDAAGIRSISVAEFIAMQDNLVLNLSSEGYPTSLIAGVMPSPATVTPAAPTSSMSTNYDFEPDFVTASTNHGQIKTHTAGMDFVAVVWHHPHAHTSEAKWSAAPKTLIWGQWKTSATGAEGRGAMVRQIAWLADNIELDAAKTALVIEPGVVSKISLTTTQMLTEAGAKIGTGGEMRITRDQLIALRDQIMQPLAQPLPYIQDGPLPVALDYVPGLLGKPSSVQGMSPAGVQVMDLPLTSSGYRPSAFGDALEVTPMIEKTTTMGGNQKTRDSLSYVLKMRDVLADKYPVMPRIMFAPNSVAADVRAAMLHNGAVEKAGYLVFDRGAFDAFAAKVAETPPVPAVGAKAIASTGPYMIEAWNGLGAVGFSTQKSVASGYKKAITYAVDQGADRVTVRNAQGKIVAEFNGVIWKHGQMDDAGWIDQLVSTGDWDPPLGMVSPDIPVGPVAGAPKKDWATAQEMVDDLTKRYSSTDPKYAGAATDFSDLLQLDFSLSKPVMQEVDAIMSRFGVVPSFRGVKVPTGKSSNMIAEIKRPVSDVPGSYMYLPLDKWGEPKAIEKLWKNAAMTPEWAIMSKADTMEQWVRAVIVHEMGHEYMGLHLYSRFGEKGDEIRAKVDAWFADYRKISSPNYYGKNQISTYGKQNDHEAWAEAFAAAFGPIPMSSDPRINELRAILEAQYPASSTFVAPPPVTMVEAPKVTPTPDPLPAPKPTPAEAIATLDNVGTDTKIKYGAPTGGKVVPMTQTDYGQWSAVWWRIGNDIEIAAADLDEAAFAAHMLRMGKVFADNPKLKVLRFRNEKHLTPGQRKSIVDAGALQYNVTGLKLTREQVLDFNQSLVNDTAEAVANALPPPEPAVTSLGDQYGFNGLTAGKLNGDITKQTGNYSKVEWTGAGQPGTVTTRYAVLKTEVVWDRIFGEAMLMPDAAARQVKLLAGILEQDEAFTRIRFERLDQIPKPIKDMLEAHGATYGDNVMYLPRENALQLRAALEVEMNHIPVAEAVEAIPVPTAVTDTDATIWELAGVPDTLPMGATGGVDVPVKSLVGMQPGISGTLSTGETMRTWDGFGGVVTYEKAQTFVGGKARWQFEGLSVPTATSTENITAVTLLHAYALANKASAAGEEFAIRSAVWYGGPGGTAGKAIRDALLKAGATQDGAYIVLSPDLSKAFMDAIYDNTKLLPPTPGVVPTPVNPLTADAKLSAQYGYNPQTLQDWTNVTHGGTTGPSSQVMVGFNKTEWYIDMGDYSDIGQVKVLGFNKPSTPTFGALSPTQMDMHDLALLKHLDAVAVANPDAQYLVWAPSDFGELATKILNDIGAGPLAAQSGLKSIDTAMLHELALKIDNNAAIEAIPLGSAAEPVVATVKPDILPTMGFAQGESLISSQFNQHAPTLYGISEPGHNATSYMNGLISSEWDMTADEVIWTHLMSNGVASTTDHSRVALAEIRRFAQHIESAEMQSMLVTDDLLTHGTVGPQIKALLMGYGGKVQLSGAVVIKRADLTDLWHAIDDQLGVTPISDAATGTVSQIGGFSKSTYESVAWVGVSLADEPGSASGATALHYVKTYVLKDHDYVSVWGWTEGSEVEWVDFAGPAAASVADVHAASAKVLQQLSEVAGEGGSALIVHKTVLDKNPQIKSILEAFGATPYPGQPPGALFVPGWDTMSMGMVIASNGKPVGEAATFNAAAATVVPTGKAAVVQKADLLLDILYSTTLKGNDFDELFLATNQALKSIGHQGLPLSDYFNMKSKGTLASSWDDGSTIANAWNNGYISTPMANSLIGGKGYKPDIADYVQADFPFWLEDAVENNAASWSVPNVLTAQTPAEKLAVIDEIILKVQNGDVDLDVANATLKSLGHPGLEPEIAGLGTPTGDDFAGLGAVDASWNAGLITTEQADQMVSYFDAGQNSIKAYLGVEYPEYLKGTIAAAPSGPAVQVPDPTTLSQQATGKTTQQLEDAWSASGNSTGYYTYNSTDTSLPYHAAAGDPQKTLAIGTIEYKARRIITSPFHGKGEIGGYGWKGSWGSGGSEEQRVEALWLGFKRAASDAANPPQLYKGYYAGYVDQAPKALFVHGDATRINPIIKDIMESFGAKKKTLKVGKIGVGYEVPVNRIAELNAFLNSEALFVPPAGKTLSVPPPPAAPAGTSFVPGPEVSPETAMYQKYMANQATKTEVNAVFPGTIPADWPETNHLLAGVDTPPAVASPTMPTPEPIAPTPVQPATLGNAYGYDQSMVTNLSHDTSAAIPSLTVVEQSKAGAATQVFKDQWANKVHVTWANEKMTAKSRVLRIRKVETETGAIPTGTAGSNALLASIVEMDTRLAADPTLIALIVEKKAIADMPGIGQMLKDAGWKETASSWTLKAPDLQNFGADVLLGKASWMPMNTIPQSVPAAPSPTMGVGQTLPPPQAAAPPTPVLPPEPTGPPPAPPEAPPLTVAGVPKKATPSFIYGYDNVRQKHIGQSLATKDRPDAVDAMGKPVQEGVAPFITAHKGMEAHWSVSKSGKAVGWTNIAMDSAMSSEEARDAAFAMLRHIAAEGSVRETFFISPAAYDQVPGLRQILLDAGGSEESYAVLGTSIQVKAEQAAKIVAALDGDVMTGLKVQISTTSDYLGFEGAALEGLGDTPNYIDAFHHQWKVGDETPTIETIVALDERTATWQNIDGGSAADKATAAMAQMQWVSDQGIESLTILPAVIHDIPKFDKWLLSVGATVEDGNLVLDAVAINNARKHIVKNALPDLLGGSKMPYSVIDEMNASTATVIEALHGELVTVAGTGKASAFTVHGQQIATSWTKSDSNLYWSSISRGEGASIGHMRTAAAAQLRSFLNMTAQNGSIGTIDINMAVLEEVPSLRAVLLKYGAKQIPAKGKAEAYITLDRSRALKLRNDLDAELSQASAGIGTTFIEQHNAMVKWPTVEDLTVSETALAQKVVGTGQTRKAVFTDSEGNEWLFKPGLSGRGAATDRAVAQLAEMLGLPVPPIRIYTLEYHGAMVEGSLQKMIPGQGMKSSNIQSLFGLTPGQTEELLRHSVLDWLVANDDAHIGNWIIDGDNHLWAIDKARAWVSFHTRQDVLDTASEGNLGGTPWLFAFFRDARQNPQLLSRINPQSVARPLRVLRNITDEEFLRIVEPAALAKAADRKAGGAYYGKPDRLLADMLKRKHEIAQDFERYISGEIREIAKLHPGQVPQNWTRWLDEGGTINLDATVKDLWLEEKALLDTKYGASGAAAVAKARQLMQENHLRAVVSKITSYFGSGYHGTGHVKGYGAELIRNAVRRSSTEGEALLREWEELNRWALLNIVSDPTAGVGGHYDDIRRYWDAEKGTFRIIRSTNRYGADPKAYIPGYQRDGGLRDLIGTAVGREVVIAAHGGVYVYFEVGYDQVFSNFALGFAHGGGGEKEFLISDARIDQIILVRRQGDPLPHGEIMTYQGPVDTK